MNSPLARAAGVLRHPRSTFQQVVQAPRWGALLAVTTAAGVIAAAAVFSTGIGRQALVDQWERTAVAFGQPVDDARYAELQALSTNSAVYGTASALLNGPVLTVAMAVGIYLVLRRRGRSVEQEPPNDAAGRPSFRQVMAVAVHAGVVLAVRQVVAAPAVYLRETTSSATAVGVWFPGFDEASPVARLLGAIDLFVVWWLVVLAIGVAVLYRRPAGRLALTFLGLYAAVAAALTVAMALLGGTA